MSRSESRIDAVGARGGARCLTGRKNKGRIGMAQQQMTTPMMVRDGEISFLQRIPFKEKFQNESWLQQLLFDYPEMLPVYELEPVFSPLIPVARELGTPAGPIDLVYINHDGFITLAETKLWRNPEARRSVVAQILDYTKELARWSYQELVSAVCDAWTRMSLVAEGDPLIQLASDESESFDESAFTDAVSRNLRLGRFLLLIVGDGIREDVEHLSEFLQQTPQYGFSLGLVEMGLYRVEPGQDNPLFVQPRVLARTQEVTRAVVEIRQGIRAEDVNVTLPAVPSADGGGSKKSGRKKLTEDVFFEKLSGVTNRATVEFAKQVLSEAGDHELEVAWGDSGPMLKYVDDDAGEITLAQLRKDGTLGMGKKSLFNMSKKHGLSLSIGQQYIDALAALIPGATRKRFAKPGGKTVERLVMGEDAKPMDLPPLRELSSKKEQFFDAVDEAILNLRQAIEDR